MIRALRPCVTAGISRVAYRKIQVSPVTWLAMGLILGAAMALAILLM